MSKQNQHSIDRLIDYYINLIEVNNEFVDLQFGGDKYRYEDLVKRLDSIRQLMIDKNLANVNIIYKPMLELFNYKEHYTILEEAIKFYRQNPDVDYPISTIPQGTHHNNKTALTPDNNRSLNEGNYNNLIEVFSSLASEIKLQQSGIEELINSKFNNDNFNKFSNDMLATLSTSRELMRSDIAKYDVLLTEHVNKSGINTVEAIEKEHSRFVQKIALDSNAIIAGIIETVAGEVAVQTDLIKNSMKSLNDKSFKWACIVFISGVCALFACSILSSTWAASKNSEMMISHIVLESSQKFKKQK